MYMRVLNRSNPHFGTQGNNTAGARIAAMPTKPAAAPVANDAPSSAAKVELTGPQRALQRMGLVRPIDLALPLPLRYEDETQVTPIDRAFTGEKVQVEGVVLESRVE